MTPSMTPAEGDVGREDPEDAGEMDTETAVSDDAHPSRRLERDERQMAGGVELHTQFVATSVMNGVTTAQRWLTAINSTPVD